MVNAQSLRIVVLTFITTTGVYYLVQKSQSSSPHSQLSIAPNNHTGDSQYVDPAVPPVTSSSALPSESAQRIPNTEPVPTPVPTPQPVSAPAASHTPSPVTRSGGRISPEQQGQIQSGEVKPMASLPTPENAENHPERAPAAAIQPASLAFRSNARSQSVQQQPNAFTPNATPTTTGQVVCIPAGTKIVVTINDHITTTASQDGQGGPFAGKLHKAIRIHDQTVADKGSPVEGRFVLADDGKGHPVLRLTLLRVRTIRGTTVPIETTSVTRGESKPLKKEILIVGGAVFIGVFNPQAGFTVAKEGFSAVNPNKGGRTTHAQGAVMPTLAEGAKVDFKLTNDIFYRLP